MYESVGERKAAGVVSQVERLGEASIGIGKITPGVYSRAREYITARDEIARQQAEQASRAKAYGGDIVPIRTQPQTQQPTQVTTNDGTTRGLTRGFQPNLFSSSQTNQNDISNPFIVRPANAARNVFFPTTPNGTGRSNGSINTISTDKQFRDMFPNFFQAVERGKSQKELTILNVPVSGIITKAGEITKETAFSAAKGGGKLLTSVAQETFIFPTQKALQPLVPKPFSKIYDEPRTTEAQLIRDPDVQTFLISAATPAVFVASPIIGGGALTLAGAGLTAYSGYKFVQQPSIETGGETLFAGATTLAGGFEVLRAGRVAESFQGWRLSRQLPKEQRASFRDILTVEKGTRGVESPIKKEFQYEQLSNVKPVAKEARAYFLTEPDAVAFGSGAGASQVPTSGEIFYGRRLGDMDVFVKQPEITQKALLKTLSPKGYIAEGSGIVRTLPGERGKTAHAFDIKPFKISIETVQDVPLSERPGSTPLSDVWSNLRTYQIGKDIKIVGMEQLTTAKAASLSGVRTTPEGSVLGPPPHRAAKDISDFFKQADFLLAQTPKSAKQLVSMTRAREALARLKVDPYIQSLIKKGKEIGDLPRGVVIGRGEDGTIPVSVTAFTPEGGLTSVGTSPLQVQRPGLRSLPVTEMGLESLPISETRMTARGTLETTGVSRTRLKSLDKSRTEWIYEPPRRVSLVERPSQIFSNIRRSVGGSGVSRLPSLTPRSPGSRIPGSPSVPVGSGLPSVSPPPSPPSIVPPYEPPSMPPYVSPGSPPSMPPYVPPSIVLTPPPSFPPPSRVPSGGGGFDVFGWERRKGKRDVYAPSIIATGLKLTTKKKGFKSDLITPFSIRPIVL